MTFLVFCVFDLTHATREDYLYAYMDLADLGLRQTIKSDGGPSFKRLRPRARGMAHVITRRFSHITVSVE